MAKAKDPSEEPLSGESQEAAPAQDERPSADEYTTTGNTVVKTLAGHRVVPEDKSLPVVDHNGVKMSATNAQKVVEEYPDYAFIEEGE